MNSLSYDVWDSTGFNCFVFLTDLKQLNFMIFIVEEASDLNVVDMLHLM